MKKGISLIVLTITIVVMIILATAVIFSLNNTDIISKAGEAVDKTTLENMQEQANIKVSEILSNRAKSQTMTSVQIKAEVEEDLKETYKEKDLEKVAVKYDDGTVTVIPVTNASSADWEVQVNQTTGYGTVVGYTGKGGSVTLPSKVNINGKEVKIKYVELVGMDLNQMTVDAGEDDVTFDYLRNEKYAIKGINDITSIIISEGIEEVTIFDCIHIETVTLPSTLKKIILMAANFSLKAINIPEGVTTIGEGCFTYNENLETATFPTTITSFGAVAFNETPWLYNQPDGPIYAGNVFLQYKGELDTDANLVIKEGTVVIADDAFDEERTNEVNESNTINSLVLPNTLEYIGEYVFRGFTVMDGINIPASVISIGRRAFYEANLNSITIPSSVEYIGNYAFANIGGIGVNRKINIYVNKTEIECDTFDTSWSCRIFNNFVERHDVTYLPQ